MRTNAACYHKAPSRLRRLTILLLLAYWVFLPAARAVSPPPDGGYPNGNTAEGEDALFSLTIGDNNTAVGFHALFSTTKGDNNTAVGWVALQHNTAGLANTAIGSEALQNNTIGDANTAVGMFSLFTNSTGLRNTTVGVESLKRNNGSDNIALGYEAGMNIGTGSHTICIGHPGVNNDSNTIRIGTTGIHTATFMAGISGVTVADGVGVIVGANGQLGTAVSSARFKDGIKPMDKSSEAILALKPVIFHYKKELDPRGIPQFGLVAEDVAKVDSDLVARDEKGKPYAVRYEAVNAMLLNEFLKEHRKVEEQEADIAQLKSTVRMLTATLRAQAAQIQKVDAQLEANKPGSRVATNNSAPDTSREFSQSFYGDGTGHADIEAYY